MSIRTLCVHQRQVIMYSIGGLTCIAESLITTVLGLSCQSFHPIAQPYQNQRHPKKQINQSDHQETPKKQLNRQESISSISIHKNPTPRINKPRAKYYLHVCVQSF